MQPIIKWPGGKSSELKIITRYVPKEYDRYVEPFFGGGALFFEMCPESAVINDISSNLMRFYSLVARSDKRFVICLKCIADAFDTVKKEGAAAAEKLLGLYRAGKEDETLALADEYSGAIAEAVGMLDAVPGEYALKRELYASVKDRLARLAANEKRLGKMSDEDAKENIVTGFAAGFYTDLRTVMNDTERGERAFLSDEYRTAVFFFVREFCYGSMFRYNRNGDFNIPYGGNSYNKKDFGKKVESLAEAAPVLSRAQIFSRDFEEIFDMAGKDDFVFLDPPYDSDFSEYEAVAFTADDHRRLSECVAKTPAKALLIIKNTPLIGELYSNKGLNIVAFDNKYSYCVRGRNDRAAEHLIITNYPIL